MLLGGRGGIFFGACVALVSWLLLEGGGWVGVRGAKKIS